MTSSRLERHPWLTRLLLVVAPLVLVEILLRVVDPSPLAFVRAARRIHAYSRSSYVDLMPSTTAHYRLLASDGRSLFNFLVTTNRHGFRVRDRGIDDDLSERGPTSGTKLVHAVGDSYTMGWGVDYSSSYPALLEWLLPQEYTVLNLGVDGYGTIGATEKSMALASSFPPAHAVYLFVPNDFEDDERAVATARRSPLGHFAFESYDLLRRHTSLFNLPFAVKWFRVFAGQEDAAGGGGTVQRLERARVEGLVLNVDPATARPASADHPSLRQIVKYADFLARSGGRLTVFVLSTQQPSLAFYRFCRDHGIPAQVIELPPEMRLRGDGHFNLLGNYCVARLALAAITGAEAPKPTR